MSSSIIAMWVALGLVSLIVLSLAGLSMLSGIYYFFFGKPKLTFLKSEQGDDGLAFGFRWNSAREPMRIDVFRVRLFNPFGNPTQVEVSKKFENKNSSFSEDLSMGPGYEMFLNAKGFDRARVLIEVSSSRDGVTFHYEMSGNKFRNQVSSANLTKEQFVKKYGLDKKKTSKPPIGIPERSFINDTTIVGDGAMLKIATNPMYSEEFAAAAKANAPAAEAQENFKISKVWIEPGCIICNACEDIYPEVFDVQADTCYIRPEPPLDDGLRIEEAAEACPVEVIKFTKS